MQAKYIVILMVSSFCVIILPFYYLLLNTAFGNLCENSIISEVSSDKYTATVFTRGCGAITSEYSYINIRKKDEDFDFESSPNKQVFLLINSEQTQISWKDVSDLAIDCQDCLIDGINKANSNAVRVFNDLQIKSEVANSK